MSRQRIVIIGAGNVATHLTLALRKKADIVQIFGHTPERTRKLAEAVGDGVSYETDINRLADADAYIVSIKDDAIAGFLNSVPARCRRSLWMHTSGSVGIDVFEGFNDSHGILYPLQTFSIDVDLNMEEVHFFCEGNHTDAETGIQAVARLISDHVHHADSDIRRQLHIAAVFACNFVNHMYTAASDILERNQLPFSALLPLIKETTRKAVSYPAITPYEAQTGPAVRGDRNIIGKHLSMLEGTEKEIYETVSNAILKRHNKA